MTIIFSGYEVYKDLKHIIYWKIEISDLNCIFRLRKSKYKTVGRCMLIFMRVRY